jgi:hypothetical protein
MTKGFILWMFMQNTLPDPGGWNREYVQTHSPARISRHFQIEKCLDAERELHKLMRDKPEASKAKYFTICLPMGDLE